MKPREYVSKYRLDTQESFNHSMFVADLAIDFQSQIEYQKSVGQYGLSHFENIVKQIKQKFDSISYKSKMSIDKWDKLWKFFYASVVVKVRESDFGEQLRKQREEKQKKWEERRRWDRFDSFGGFGPDPFESFFNGFFRKFFDGAFRDFAMSGGFGGMVPSKEFAELGIPETSSVEDINSAFRKMALIHHPDKGGNSTKFQSILESKNRCIMYAENRI